MKARIEVDLGHPIGAVDPLIYGQFLSRRRWVADGGLHDPKHPDAGSDGIRRQVRDRIARLRPSVIRWPGGCTGTSYWWEAGIGPAQARPRTVDWHFGYDVANDFGTVEFVDFCRSVGAEPHLNFNTATASLRNALDWVEYVNGTGSSPNAELRRRHGRADPLNVRYWQIGNEDWGEWEIGQCSADENAVRAREWAKAIKRIDDGLKLIAVGCWRPEESVEWNAAVLDQAWDQVDYLAVHTYWRFSGRMGEAEYDRIVAAGFIEEDGIRALGGLVDLVARQKGTARRPRLAFTEWNCADTDLRGMSAAWRPEAPQFRLMDALAVAGFLNAMQRQCRLVGLANFAQTINVVGALFVDQDHVVPETVYWPLLMQRENSGPISVPAHVECDGYLLHDHRHLGAVPYLDASATHDERGRRAWISVVNRSRDDEMVTDVVLRDRSPKPAATVIQLAADDPLAQNTPDSPDAVLPRTERVTVDGDLSLSLPPHSYTIVALEY
ncbi:alpha-L-arabinofuranosidase C-terminal domain-containing protein [Jiangella asiatica]|uniref:non-reducing end alpha-L-arabinofuranosidase n=1 Tax=Jiangella asiatica TaxID=2530372 RepID=A0A4R5CLU3_9ACTN|nr:alpha-L-arabinofuranosidase C-terminal domain-containing protein [Jiangella asiatica]TDE00200.1 hypothetical protein E1269_26165 [Jiangella asiatica]